MDSLPYHDPVIAAFKPGVDRSLLRQNLQLTPAQRMDKMVSALRMVAQLKRATIRPPQTDPS
jgi:hypothetical protein